MKTYSIWLKGAEGFVSPTMERNMTKAGAEREKRRLEGVRSSKGRLALKGSLVLAEKG